MPGAVSDQMCFEAEKMPSNIVKRIIAPAMRNLTSLSRLSGFGAEKEVYQPNMQLQTRLQQGHQEIMCIRCGQRYAYEAPTGTSHSCCALSTSSTEANEEFDTMCAMRANVLYM
jgi:hypothetical protein